jgi:peptide-methionine (S)-S-oxide reductase
VQVDYDPQRITYSRLLDTFWQSHDPGRQSWSRQYLNVIFYANEKQRRMAMESKAAMEKELGRPVKSEVLPLRTFTLAEDYHQKYLLKHNDVLKKEMSRIYPLHRDFIDSTAVARLNGYAGGYGGAAQLAREIDRLGLSDAGKRVLTGIVKHGSGL